MPESNTPFGGHSFFAVFFSVGSPSSNGTWCGGARVTVTHAVSCHHLRPHATLPGRLCAGDCTVCLRLQPRYLLPPSAEQTRSTFAISLVYNRTAKDSWEYHRPLALACFWRLVGNRQHVSGPQPGAKAEDDDVHLQNSRCYCLLTGMTSISVQSGFYSPPLRASRPIKN